MITERDDIEIPRGVWFAKSYLYISDEKIDAVEVAARLVAHSLER